MSDLPDGLPGVPLDPNIERLRSALAAYDEWPPKTEYLITHVIDAARMVLHAYDEQVEYIRHQMAVPLPRAEAIQAALDRTQSGLPETIISTPDGPMVVDAASAQQSHQVRGPHDLMCRVCGSWDPRQHYGGCQAP